MGRRKKNDVFECTLREREELGRAEAAAIDDELLDDDDEEEDTRPERRSESRRLAEGFALLELSGDDFE